MILFRRELRKNLKPLLIWSAALSALILIMMSVFTQMAKEAELLEQLTAAFPEGMLKVFGMDTLNMADVLGFYGVEVYSMTTLFGSIYAAILASGILSKEQSEKTIEFLLSKPVTRTRILTEKLAAALLYVVIFNLVIIVVSAISFLMIQSQEVDWSRFLLLSLAQLLLHAAFAAAGFFLSSIMNRSRTILPVSLGLVMVLYFVFVAANLSDSLSFLLYITPFHYVDAADILESGTLNVLSVTVIPLILLIGTGSAYVIYRRRDISV